MKVALFLAETDTNAIPLPEGAEVDKAAAEFINGVLEVSIPVPKIEHKRREIPVKEGVKVKAA